MKKSVKTLAFLTTSFLFLNCLHAQLKLPVVNGIGNDIRKVVEEYPNHFSSLVGEMLVENAQSVEYKCNCSVTGAEEVTITRYSSKANNVYSWQTLMLTTESFEKAKQKFRALYTQLNNLPVNPGGVKSYHLKGQYESPVEEKKFTSVLFSLDPADEPMRKLKAELSLRVNESMEWEVKVLIYDRDREDDERGKVKED
jgi:hypothetical protein